MRRPSRRLNEVEQAARAADLPAADHLGVGLAEQVHLDDGVDRDEAVEPRDDVTVMGIADRPEIDGRAGSQGVVKAARADREAGDRPPGIDRLP